MSGSPPDAGAWNRFGEFPGWSGRDARRLPARRNARRGSPGPEGAPTRGTIGAIIGTIIFGAVIGFLARLVLPGKQSISALITILLGVAGALIGSAVWEALGGGPTRGIDWIRWFISIAAAAGLVVGYESIMNRRKV